MGELARKQPPPLAELSIDRIKELVSQCPTDKRAALSKALKAASQHLKDSRQQYEHAFAIAEQMVENWWLLGVDLKRLKIQGRMGRHTGPTKSPNLREDFVQLSDLGISDMQSSRCQLLADRYSKAELHDFIEKLYKPEIYKLPTLLSVAKGKAPDAVDTPAINGMYDVIVIDPPWPMQKLERETVPEQMGFDYPTMTEEKLAALELPCADNCHVWLWTTHKFLPMAFRLLAAWKLKYVCAFVWHKPGGFQPFNFPQYNCEFALYARHGAPRFASLKQFSVCFDAPRGSHSEKPQVFYDMVSRVTDGARLDMFNRRAIDGFHGWGNEAAS